MTLPAPNVISPRHCRNLLRGVHCILTSLQLHPQAASAHLSQNSLKCHANIISSLATEKRKQQTSLLQASPAIGNGHPPMKPIMFILHGLIGWALELPNKNRVVRLHVCNSRFARPGLVRQAEEHNANFHQSASVGADLLPGPSKSLQLISLK